MLKKENRPDEIHPDGFCFKCAKASVGRSPNGESKLRQHR
jgi:hypothetical protein